MHIPVFLKYSLLLSVEQFFLFVYLCPQNIMRNLWDLCCSKAVLLLTLTNPPPGVHSCSFLNELADAIPQRLDLLKELIDSGTVVPVFLWAGSPSSTPSKISRRKKNQQKIQTPRSHCSKVLALILHVRSPF